MERRMSNSPAVLAERARIVWLWLCGSSVKSISQQTGASLSVVYRWIHRWQEEGSVRNRPYHRRLRKVRWIDDQRQTAPEMMNSSLIPTKEKNSLVSKQQPITLAQATLTMPNPTTEREFLLPVINDSSFQGFHCSKIFHHYISQTPWHSTLQLY